MLNEKREIYYLKLVFNHRLITKITITDYYKKKHPDIADKLILEILTKKLNHEKVNPYEWEGQVKRQVFRWHTTYQDKKYRLIFWYEDNNPHGLWIRNCYRID
ncbi:MAG: hypothetical protein MRERV_4c044 [Mycoplasmataceae bacterium RV_VA103A]|nr:MAG: hypothetical protein MRERV_11c007 [Mycoplasmataceae bacterium RV_VA103A]KLL05153.1 MAG: hypothetical protein MRERV_4c044 [Mycoplasmataceae bacterium RV_VA103A]